MKTTTMKTKGVMVREPNWKPFAQ